MGPDRNKSAIQLLELEVLRILGGSLGCFSVQAAPGFRIGRRLCWLLLLLTVAVAAAAVSRQNCFMRLLLIVVLMLHVLRGRITVGVGRLANVAAAAAAAIAKTNGVVSMLVPH